MGPVDCAPLTVIAAFPALRYTDTAGMLLTALPLYGLLLALRNTTSDAPRIGHCEACERARDNRQRRIGAKDGEPCDDAVKSRKMGGCAEGCDR